MSIVDASGAVVAEYEYDPYGNIISATGALAEINPLRYRGYIYDPESNLYYLQSRYYVPSMGRFLNADAFASTGQGIIGDNMFAYCGNDPISYADTSGTMRVYVKDFDVSQYVPVAGSSDKQMNSDMLLQYLKEKSAGNTGNTYYYTVQYVGTYSHKIDYTGDLLRFGVAVVAFVMSNAPGVREVAGVATALTAYSAAELGATGVDLYHKMQNPLSAQDYHQYRVTLHYYEDTKYNGRTYRTVYNYELYYLWDHRSHDNPSWYFQKGVDNSYSYYVD